MAELGEKRPRAHDTDGEASGGAKRHASMLTDSLPGVVPGASATPLHLQLAPAPGTGAVPGAGVPVFAHQDMIRCMIAELERPENLAKFQTVVQHTGGDMIELIRNVFPLSLELQAPVLLKFGFTADARGTAAFGQLVRDYEDESDQEYLELADKVRSAMFPLELGHQALAGFDAAPVGAAVSESKRGEAAASPEATGV